MMPPRTLSKASLVKWIKTIRLSYVVDAAMYNIMDVMVLIVFSTRIVRVAITSISEPKFKGQAKCQSCK